MADKPIELLVTPILSAKGSVKLIYTQTDGGYVGTIEAHAMTPHGLKAMADHFQGQAAAAAGGIAVVNSLNGMHING